MLHVLTPEEVYALIRESFNTLENKEAVPLSESCGRVLSSPVLSGGDEPPFNRSTVDGYAVKASDTFGASESLPAILEMAGQIYMGEPARDPLPEDACIRIPTGGAVPEGANAIAMQEFTEDFEDGTIGITKPVSPGENMIFKGDDMKEGDVILPAGKRLTPKDIGALASLGMSDVTVQTPLTVGIISTGDELVPESEVPGPGQIRDINSQMLGALCQSEGCRIHLCGIVKDDLDLLTDALKKALAQCDIIILSGGSSVGEKDNSVKAITRLGELLFHGVAIRPGKPTLLGKADGKPVFGLPGHPQAAFFTAKLFVCAMIDRLSGHKRETIRIPATLSRSVSANDGRELYLPVTLKEENGILTAIPLHGKSGLIATLTRADGYICIERNREGIKAGDAVNVYLF